ncbi:MAG: sugar porter family MFS transporter [Chlamydiales bacterium]|nr:sugar porter family MFS transporter [Chlamydiales bacterium]
MTRAKSSERLSAYGWIAIVTVSLGGFLFGFHSAVVSGALGVLQKKFLLTPLQEGLIVSLLLLGAGVGSIFAGTLSDYFGRKRMILITGLVFTIGAATTASAADLTMILLGRLLTGFGVGFISLAAPLYLAEISPPSKRGAIVATNQFVGTIGILTAYVVNYLFLDTGNWRAMFAVGMIPSGLLMLGMIFLPDTPEWLLAHRTEDSAKDVLQKLRKDKSWESHLAEMKRVASPRKDSSWHRLFTPSVKFALFVGVMLSVLQQITGINGVIYYAPKIFIEAGFGSDATSVLATMGIGVINVLTTFLALKLLDRAGRRPLLLIGVLGMLISLLILSGSLFMKLPQVGPIAVVTLMSYVAFFALGMGPIPWLILAEIYPLSVRGRAMSIATAANWFFNFLIAITFLDMIKFMGSAGVFLLFAAISLIAFFAIKRYVPETKGKSLEEIELHMNEMRNRR